MIDDQVELLRVERELERIAEMRRSAGGFDSAVAAARGSGGKPPQRDELPDAEIASQTLLDLATQVVQLQQENAVLREERDIAREACQRRHRELQRVRSDLKWARWTRRGGWADCLADAVALRLRKG